MFSKWNLKENLSDTTFNSIERINKLPGRRFVIPKFSSIRFTAKNSQVRNLPMVSNWIEEMFKYSKLSDKTFDVKIRNVFECVFAFFPVCNDLARYEWIFKYIYLLFIIDDHCELDVRNVDRDKDRVMDILEQLRHSMNALRQQKSLSKDRDWEPYIEANTQVMSKICGSYNEVQSILFIEAFEEYFEGVIQETLAVVEYMHCKSIKDYFNVRYRTSSVLTVIRLIEYCLGLTLTRSEYEDPLTQLCIKYTNKCIILSNDIFSFEKEYNKHHGELDKMWNAVSTYALINSCAVEEAIIAIAAKNDRCEQKLIDSVCKAVNRTNISKDHADFLKHLQVLVGGNTKYSTLVDRYNYFVEQAEI